MAPERAPPSDVIEKFVEWTRTMRSNTHEDGDMSKIILAAHYGSCHDHLYLLKMMIM